MKIISCLALIVASVEGDCREGSGQCALWMPTQKVYCIAVSPGETSLSCSSLPLFSSSLPHWYFYQVVLSSPLWLPPAPFPLILSTTSPSSGDEEQKPNWVQLVVSQVGL